MRVELEGLADIRPTEGPGRKWDFTASGNEEELDDGREEEDESRSSKHAKHGVEAE